MPLAYLAAYGAGIQVHVEDLTAYLAGREPATRTHGSMSSRPLMKSWRP